MDLRIKINHYGFAFCFLVVVQAYLFSPGTTRADDRCSLPQPISVGDARLEVRPFPIDQLPPEAQNAALGFISTEYEVSLIVKSNFSEDRNVSDYLVFYDNYNSAAANAYIRHRLLIIRWDSAKGARAFPVLRVGASVDSWESGLADLRPDDLNIFKSSTGIVYAKTIGYFRGNCWETIIFPSSEQFVAQNIFFGTSDGFNYPVGPVYPADIQTIGYLDNWKVDQTFQDCINYPQNIGPCKHLGEDFNGRGGGNTDLGYPVFAISRGEVIFAGDRGPGWNGIVILRHRPPTGKDIYSFYGHLNIDPGARRADGSAIRTVSDILRLSALGNLIEAEKGQLIGYVGPPPTKDTSSHLHFEIISDPAIAYDVIAWNGYRQLHGSEEQWRNPSKFIEKNRRYFANFGVGEDWAMIGIPPAVFQECYERNGGVRIFGQPIGIIFDGYPSPNGTSWTSQAFQNGEIYYHKDGQLNGKIFAILNPLLAKFRILSPARVPTELPDLWGYNPIDISKCPLGLPIMDVSPIAEISSRGTKFKFQNFENGSLEFHLTGPCAGEVFEIHGAIFDRWKELGYAAGPLGLPITDERESLKSPVSGLTGRNSIFEGGIVHWVRETNKIFVIGLNQNAAGRTNIGKLISDRYKDEGGSGGVLGLPTSDDYLWQNGVRCDFENGCVIWTPAEGIQTVVFKK